MPHDDDYVRKHMGRCFRKKLALSKSLDYAVRDVYAHVSKAGGERPKSAPQRPSTTCHSTMLDTIDKKNTTKTRGRELVDPDARPAESRCVVLIA